MSEYPICPQCNEPTVEGDYYPCSDGSAYHVYCFQAAMLAAEQPDPFPLCDYCQQIIWQTADDGGLALVVKGLTGYTDPETGRQDFRPARWHPECAPGEGEEYAGVPDRIDHPPAQPQPHGVPESEPAASQVVVDTSTDHVPRAPLGTPCTKCSKPIQRGLLMHEGHPYHTLCAKRAGAQLKVRPKCSVCGKAIRPEAEIECENADGTTSWFDRKCYRAECLAAGMPDPFPNSARGRKSESNGADKTGETRLCRACGVHVPRAEFRDHVSEHEQQQWAKR